MKFNAKGERIHDIYDTVDECWAENKALRAENGRLRAELDEARALLSNPFCAPSDHMVTCHIEPCECGLYAIQDKYYQFLDLAAAKSNLCSICGSRAMSKTERGSDVCLECGWVQKAKDTTT